MLRCLEDVHTHLNLSLVKGVLTIEINRPECKNALNGDLYTLITNILNEADPSPDVRVVILRGNATDFSAGNDMKYFLFAVQTQESIPPGSTPPFLFLKALAQFSKPMIAAVRGVAIGVGVTLLSHCDLVYADRSASFQLPFVNLGLTLEGASSLLFSQKAGYHLAAELLLTGQKFNAEKALSARLINAIVEDPYTFSTAQAHELALLPIASLQIVKSQMKHNLQQILACIDHEAEIVCQRIQSPELMEAISAFMQKRKPDFSPFNA